MCLSPATRLPHFKLLQLANLVAMLFHFDSLKMLPSSQVLVLAVLH